MAVRRWVVAIAGVLIVWMGGYALLTRDPDTTAYRELCVQSAQSALDGLGTARMATADGLLSGYRTALSDDAQKLIGQARSRVAGQIPPGDRSDRRRDALMPLLDQVELVYEDLVMVRGDEQAERAAVERTVQLEGQLRDFIDGNR